VTTPRLIGGRHVRVRHVDNLPCWVLEYEDVDALLDDAIAHDTPAPYGAVLWHSSEVASRWITTHLRAGQRVVDVGTGNGLCALVAAHLDAEVVALDVDPHVLDLVDGAAQAQGVDVTTQLFDVFADAAVPDCDLVVVADVLYEPELAQAVARCVKRAHDAGAAVLVVDPQRYARAVFLDALQQQGADVAFVDETYTFDDGEQVIGVLHWS